MNAETIAYVHGSRNPITLGSLMHGGILTVAGETYDIPENTIRGDYPAEVRIVEVLAEAGYRLAADYVYAVEIPNCDGVFPVRVMKA